jgi:hypothetical protein
MVQNLGIRLDKWKGLDTRRYFDLKFGNKDKYTFLWSFSELKCKILEISLFRKIQITFR